MDQKPDVKVVSDSVPVDFPQQTTREKLFGTNDVKEFSNQRVRPINNQLPDNYSLAGKTYYFENVKDVDLKTRLRQQYPHGVHFNGAGFPDFSRYAIKKVEIDVTGKNWIDFSIANREAGLLKTPEGYTWHHHYDGKTMMLVPKELHFRSAVPHTGGAAIVKGNKK